MVALEHFDSQDVRRYVEHFGRLLSGFQISYQDENGTKLRQVPCRFASTNRQAMMIIRNMSENTLLTAPAMTYYIDSVDIARDRTMNRYDVRDELVNKYL